VTIATRQKIVYAALVVAVIWGAYNLFFTERRKPLGPVEVDVPIPTTTGQVTRASLDRTEVENLESAHWGRDPFQPIIKAAARPSDNPKRDLKWVLSGIVFNDRAPMAVINNKMVRTGDLVDQARVIAIEQESVQVEHDGRRITLKVNKG